MQKNSYTKSCVCIWNVQTYIYTHTKIVREAVRQRGKETDSEIEREMNANEKYHHYHVPVLFSVLFLNVSSSIKIILPISVQVLL